MPNWVERNDGLIKKWWKTATIDDADIVAAWQGIGANSEAASYVNLVNPGTNDLTIAAGTPTWTQAGGWAFDGSSYFDTSIVQDTEHTVMIMFTDAIMSSRHLFGSVAVTPTRSFRIRETAIDQVGTQLGVTITYFLSTGGFSQTATTDEDDRIVTGMSRVRQFHSAASPKVAENLTPAWGATALTNYLGHANGASNPWQSSILAAAIYDRALTASEMTQVANAMLSLTSTDSPNPNVNYITIHPKTRHLSSAGHILLAALDSGIFKTENGGRQWGKIELPDPSNAEFGDVPAATADELVFDWIDYAQLDPSDPTGPMAIYCRGLKTSLSRMWIYKSDDDGETWTSRGVVAT